MSASREKKLRSEQKAKDMVNPAKKKKQHQESFRRAVAVIIGAAFILALVTLFVIGTGVIPANVAAMTISGIKITPAELNYHYINAYNYEYNYGYLQYYSYYGYGDVSDPFALGSLSYTDTMSWKDYLLESAQESVKIAVAQSEQAKKEGMSLSQEDKDKLEESVSYIESLADTNNMSVKKVLESTYGRGMTMKGYKTALERVLLSQAYTQAQYDSYERSDADLESYYSEHREDFEYVSYHTFSFDRTLTAADGEEEPTEEEQADYDAAQKEKAEEMLSKVTSGNFYETSLAYKPVEESDEEESTDGEDAETETEDGTDTESEGEETEDGTEEEAEEEEPVDDTLKSDLALSSVSDESLKTYLMDTARSEGDKTLIETDSAYMVILFLDRYRNEYATVDVRHILAGSENITAEEAHDNAAAILEEWRAGDATEDSFAALANEKSTDAGSNTNGGLYEKVYKGQMVETFNDWCFDESRQPGDTGLVDTTYGTHVMYFVGDNEIYWKVQVKNTMDDEDFSANQTALVGELSVKTSSFGLSFAG